MNKGDKVQIKECHKLPDLVGREGTIQKVDLPWPSAYPVAVEIGGSLYGFREEEIELVA